MKEEKTRPRWLRWLWGTVKLLFDILLGAAVMLSLAFILWLWEPELFALGVFWGEETTRFGQYNNVVKTAASIFLLMTLMALYHADVLKLLPYSNTYFGYTDAVKAEREQNKADRRRTIRAYTIMIGGSLIPLLLAFILFPWMSQKELLPDTWTISAEPISVVSEERILLRAGDSIVSTIENNLFQLDMNEDTEYLVILRPPEQAASFYSLSFQVTGFSQSGLKVLDWALDGESIDWRLVSNSKNAVVDFEVSYTGNSPSAEYRIYTFDFEKIKASPDKETIRPWDTGESEVPFQAEAGKIYAIAAWPLDPQYSTSIGVSNSEGNTLKATFGTYLEVILFQPSDTQQYDIRIGNPDDTQHEGYEMVILSLE